MAPTPTTWRVTSSPRSLRIDNTALSLLVWFIYAPMCISTLATIKRETNSWKQMAFAAGYLFAAAWLASLVTYQVAVALGAG